jgi:hypothetical protein
METVTVYKDIYEEDRNKAWAISDRHFQLRGQIIALAEIIKTNPKFVEEELAQLAKEFS